jgi:hypothetical protein
LVPDYPDRENEVWGHKVIVQSAGRKRCYVSLPNSKFPKMSNDKMPTYIDPDKKENNKALAACIVIIASACRKEDTGFESRQGVRFLGIYTLS